MQERLSVKINAPRLTKNVWRWATPRHNHDLISISTTILKSSWLDPWLFLLSKGTLLRSSSPMAWVIAGLAGVFSAPKSGCERVDTDKS
jgi:hypothetical protein